MSTKTHGQMLEPKLKSLEQKLSLTKFDAELFKIIHFPGYTTPAEFFLVEKNIELLHGLADLIQSQMANVLTASKRIVAEATV